MKMAVVSFDLCRGRLMNNVRFTQVSLLHQDSETFVTSAPGGCERRQRRSLSSSLHRGAQKRLCHNSSTSGVGLASRRLQNAVGSVANSAKEKWHAWNTVGKFSGGSCSKLIDSLNIDLIGGVKSYVYKVPDLWSKNRHGHDAAFTLKNTERTLGTDVTLQEEAKHDSEQASCSAVPKGSGIQGVSGVVRFQETVIVTQEKIVPIEEAAISFTGSREQHNFGKAMTVKYESVQTYYNQTELPHFQPNEGLNVFPSENITFQPVENNRGVAGEQEGKQSGSAWAERPARYIGTTTETLMKTAGAAVVGSQNLISDVVKRFPKIRYTIPESVAISSQRAAGEKDLTIENQEAVVNETGRADAADALGQLPANRINGTRDIILKTAGAAVSGSQNLISDVVKRFPKISYTIPSRVALSTQKISSKEDVKQTVEVNRTPRIVHERRAKDLAVALKRASGNRSKLVRLEDLCVHLAEHPETKSIVYEANALPVVLKMRDSKDEATYQQANQALALLGYINPVKCRGVKILSLDGGGTRGLYTLELLRQLESATGKKIPELFDLISGVSTGALIATLLVVNNLSVDECERMYKDVSKHILKQARVSGITQLIRNHSYYDSDLWEERLRHAVGSTTYLDAMKKASIPKIVAVSTIMNSKWTENFLFRNYEYPRGTCSRYRGSTKHAMWEAARASSAAPFYYKDYKLEKHLHTDGGVLSNNPTGIAVHEARLLWPDAKLQCVVSIGTGRFNAEEGFHGVESSALKDKVEIFVESATCTEDTHTILHDILQPGTYFRFNPYMSEDFLLDEIRDEKWEQMNSDTRAYCRLNEAKIKRCAELLLKEKSAVQKLGDMVKLTCDKRSMSLFKKNKTVM